MKQITFGRALVAFFAVPLLIYVYREVTRDVLIIDPFTVPKSFEEVGLTPEVMANRVGDKLREIESATKTRMKKDALTSMRDEGSTPDVEIPGTKSGLKSLIEITQGLFGIYPKHISGDIVLATAPPATAESSSAESHALVTIYVTRGRERSQPICTTEGTSDADKIVLRTAELTLGQVNPYVFAAYLSDHSRFDEATAVIQQFLQNPSLDRPYRGAANILWGNVLWDQHRYDEALTKYKKAADLDPKDAGPHVGWGNALAHEKKYDEAIVEYRKATHLDPKEALAYSNWGVALGAEGKHGEAIIEYKKAIDLDPKFALAYNNWGAALNGEGNYEEAIAKCKKAIELDPKDARPHAGWGAPLYGQKNYDEAIVECKKAIEIDPKYEPAYISWALALRAQGKYAEAAQMSAKADELSRAAAKP